MSKELTTEELQNKVGELTAAISDIFSKQLGEDSYSCYINIAWTQPVKGISDPIQHISLVSTPEVDGASSYESISPLTTSLAADPFLNHVIIYNFTNNLLSTFISSDSNNVKTIGNFKYINSGEKVN